MYQVTTDWGGARSNGRTRYRKGGKFIKTPALDVDICPACNRINPPRIEPKYEGGFIDPTSMKPIRATNCHACGINFSQYKNDKAIMNMIQGLTSICNSGWMS